MLAANKRFCRNCGARYSDGPVAALGDDQPEAQTRADKIQIMMKAGSKALLKSIALSMLVLGPGFALLIFGLTIAGMIWLFCGSFGLMAWTYRKPWRLGLISCLIPPVAAALCYALQLWLFGKASPPALLLGAAIIIGLAIGYWRARSHNVVVAPDGGVVAERTIGYLLVWVAAYIVTQSLGLLAMGTFAIRAGLVTGAFSTAMLAVVSLVIWLQKSKLARPMALPGMLIALIVVGSISAFPNPAHAQSEDQEAAGALQTLKDLMTKGDEAFAKLAAQEDANGSELVTETESLTGDKNKAILKFTREGNALSNGKVTSRTKEHVTVTLTLFGSEAAARPKAKVGEERYDEEIGTVFTNVANDEKSATARSSKGRYRIEIFAEEVWHKQFSRSDERWFGIEFTAVMNLAGLLKHIDLDLVPEETEPQTGGHDRTGNDGNEGGETPAITAEQAAEFAAAIAAILIIAGVAANIAQAIAAALANALQSSVQLTAEEIEAAIAEGLAQAQDTVPEPIYHWNGESYSTNEKGEYWAPDENGTYRWMSKENALKASARERENAEAYAQQQEDEAKAEAEEEAREKRRREEYERQRRERFEKSAAEDMDNSRRKMRERDDALRADETKAKADAEAANRRHDQLYNGILNALMGMPSDARVTALINELGTTYENGDTEGLNALWGKVRGVRQSLIDQSAQKAAAEESYGRKMGMLESGATAVRDAAKKTVAGAISASGVGGVVVGTVGLVSIGLAEGGVQAKGGQIKLDGWGAAKGGARGFKDSFNAVIGGVETNGSKARAIAKVFFPSLTDSLQKTSDSFNKSGDWNKAKSDGIAEFGSKVAQSATSEAFGEQDRLSQLRAENRMVGKSDFSTWFSANQQRAQEAAAIEARKKSAAAILEFGSTMIVDGKTASEALGKTIQSQVAGSIAGNLKDGARKE